MSNKLFTTIPVPRFPSNTFSLSRSVMFCPRLQKVYVPNVIEIVPGDGMNERAEQFARTRPMVTPVFSKMNAFQEAFFVPNWQLNEHFDEFITGGEDGAYQDKMPYTDVDHIYSAVELLLRWLDSNSASINVDFYNFCIEKIQSIIEHCDLLRSVPFILPDFLLATSATLSTVATANRNAFYALNSKLNGSTLRVNYLPFGAVLKVWCEYFRDENLCDDEFDLYWKGNSPSVVIPLYSVTGQIHVSSILGGVLSTTSSQATFELWLKFMYAIFGAHNRAWKKDYFTSALPFTQKGPDVLLPLSGIFPVEWDTQSASGDVKMYVNSPVSTKPELYTNNSTPGANTIIKGSVNLQNQGLGSTIVDVRRAFALEEFYEADGRGGNRYPENTMMQFGVRTPDSRLPRAQYLGGNSSPIQVSEVVQNSESASTPQGNLAGKGISYGNNRLCRSYNTMHGFIINTYSIRTQAIYEGGIHPMFSRFDRTEYAWPRFAHLGEQPIHVKELYVDSTVTEDETFGYTPRYAEYKSERSSVHGPLKGSLNFWTMSRRFGNKPQLTEEFIYNSPRLDAFVVTNPLQAPIIVEIDYRVRANRKLPFFGVPMI